MQPDGDARFPLATELLGGDRHIWSSGPGLPLRIFFGTTASRLFRARAVYSCEGQAELYNFSRQASTASAGLRAGQGLPSSVISVPQYRQIAVSRRGPFTMTTPEKRGC